jgi:oxygen-dependent protoporphyrinogen oxidase
MATGALRPRPGAAPAKVAVLGGGIAGLTCAHYLTRLLPKTEVVLLEGADRFGGWVHSISQVTPSTHPSQDIPGELIFEAGPRTLTTKGLSGWLALDVVRNLGLEHTILTVPKTSDAAKNRLLYYPDRVAPLPNSLLKLLWHRNEEPNRGLIEALWREPKQPARHELEDESIDSFFRRRLGGEIADKIVSALCHGIYGGDSRLLSMHANFPQLVDLEQRHGSIIGGMLRNKWESMRGRASDGPLAAQEKVSLASIRANFDAPFRKDIDGCVSWSMQGGLETLIEGLVNDLGERDVDVRLGAKVTGLSPAAEGVRVRDTTSAVSASVASPSTD